MKNKNNEIQNKLRKDMLSRLKLFTWDEHTYVAQKPELIK